jgi:hypothetical protein
VQTRWGDRHARSISLWDVIDTRCGEDSASAAEHHAVDCSEAAGDGRWLESNQGILVHRRSGIPDGPGEFRLDYPQKPEP